MDTQLLKELIDEVQRYESECAGPHSLETFKDWLTGAPQQDLVEDNAHETETLESKLAGLLVMIYRYANLRIKHALSTTAVSTAAEFTCLATLLRHPVLSKLQLIEHNVMEKPTGFELIKRLQTNKYIKEIPNPKDGRSKLVMLTSKGRKHLYATFANMAEVSNAIVAPLSHKQRLDLHNSLLLLEQFHHPHYLAHNT
jgi:DNA-binding MarR family transcriptional regulator